MFRLNYIFCVHSITQCPLVKYHYECNIAFISLIFSVMNWMFFLYIFSSELDVLRRDRINSESVYRQVEIQLTDSKQQTAAMIDKLNHV